MHGACPGEVLAHPKAIPSCEVASRKLHAFAVPSAQVVDAWNVWRIWRQCAGEHGRNMQRICRECAGNMLGICKQYERNVKGICREHARSMEGICQV